MRVYFECQRCTACCRWPGQVRVSEMEIDALAGLLDISPAQFIESYTRLRVGRQGLALTEKENGECVFLEGRVCRVQKVKPGQCRDFPNRWNFPGFDELCEAVPVEISEEQYQEKVVDSRTI